MYCLNENKNIDGTKKTTTILSDEILVLIVVIDIGSLPFFPNS